MRLGTILEIKMIILYLDNWDNNEFDNALVLFAFKLIEQPLKR